MQRLNEHTKTDIDLIRRLLELIDPIKRGFLVLLGTTLLFSLTFFDEVASVSIFSLTCFDEATSNFSLTCSMFDAIADLSVIFACPKRKEV